MTALSPKRNDQKAHLRRHHHHTLFTGLASRKYSLPGSFMYDYVGDALWAAMIYLGFRTLLPNRPLQKSALYALIFTYLIEISQLYQADWINRIRHTWLGGLILGFQFLWSDVIAYTIGIACVFTLDHFANRSAFQKQSVTNS